MKLTNTLSRITILVMVAFALVLGPQIAAAEAPEPQSIVVSLKADPTKAEGIEAACVSLTIATFLGKYGGADVTLFPTLDGVLVANREVLDILALNPQRLCQTPPPEQGGYGVLPLRDLVAKFLDEGEGGGKIYVCPLCWNSRFGPADAEGHHPLLVDDENVLVTSPIGMFLMADKVIDY